MMTIQMLQLRSMLQGTQSHKCFHITARLCVSGLCAYIHVYSTCAMYSNNDLQSDALKDAEYSYATEVPGSSELQTIEVCSNQE